MKIYVLGSSHFFKEMVAAKDKLRELGIDGSIHPDYEAYARGEMQDHVDEILSGEGAELKQKNNYIKQHYQHILENDGILIVNIEKKGRQNYIGGNVLMEMGQAYVNDKKIFLTNDLPTDSAYIDEIKSVYPICLKGEIENIKKYI